MKVITSEAIQRGHFLQANKDQYRRAMSQFEERFTSALYLEFTSNAVGYNINNPKMFIDLYGMTEQEFNRAFTELIRLKFLVPQTNETYRMYREPQLEAFGSTVAIDPSSKVPAQLYVIKLTDSYNDETFYKIGVTKTTIDDRFKQLTEYKLEIVQQYWMPEEVAYSIEEALHEIGKCYKYTPHKSFGGDSECFSQVDFVKLEITMNSVHIIQ